MHIHFFFANENPVGFQLIESEEHLNLQLSRHSIHSSFQDKLAKSQGGLFQISLVRPRPKMRADLQLLEV